MIKSLMAMAALIICGSACAKSTCADIHREQSFPSLKMSDGVVCFVKEPVVDPGTRTPIGMDAISLYYIANGGDAAKAEGRGLLYDNTPGEIVDAFPAKISLDRSESIFVIHSMTVRNSLVEPNSSGKFYSVSVFDVAGKTLRRDERASDWFGADYSWISDGKNIVYRYPYLSKIDVRHAINSPFAPLMAGDKFIAAVVGEKSYLFDESNIKGKTKKYLIKGDRVVVEAASAGWCRIKYTSGSKPLDMWMMCAALSVRPQ